MDVVFLPEQFGNDAMPGGIIGVCFVMCGMVRNFFKFEMKFSLRRFSTERTPRLNHNSNFVASSWEMQFGKSIYRVKSFFLARN